MLIHTIKTLKIELKSQPWWLILLMPILARQKQMDSEFGTSLLYIAYIAGSRTARAT